MKKPPSLLPLTLLLLLTTLLPQPTHPATKKIDTSKYSNICGTSYPPLSKRGHKILSHIIPHSTISSLKTTNTPQHVALCWIIHEDPHKLSPSSGRLLQRYALVVLYYATNGPQWLHNNHWLSKQTECHWYGVTCTTMTNHVLTLDLAFNNLQGVVPREIKLLSNLRELILYANELQGIIPHGIGDLKQLSDLRLQMNGFFGDIPKEIGGLRNLKHLVLYGNYLMGGLPKEIGNLKRLEVLDVYANNIGGTVPTELGKLRNLREIYINDTNLQGTITSEMTRHLKHLKEFWADCSGNVPEVKCEQCTVCCRDDANPKCVRISSKVKRG